jgi:hypothetical protein
VLCRGHAGQTVTVLVSETALAIELCDPDDPETRLMRRTNKKGAVQTWCLVG